MSYHSKRTPGTLALEFGRVPQWNCPIAGRAGSKGSAVRSGSGNRPKPARRPKDPWFVPPIQCHEPEDGVFFVQIGPTGGENGYAAITGVVLQSLQSGQQCHDICFKATWAGASRGT